MSALANQMQDKMTVRLNELRGKVIGKMTSTGERIKSRPSLPGDKSLETVNDHLLMKQNDDGAAILGAAIGIPGVDGLIEATIDVATEVYGDRKAIHKRPQDDMDLTPKQERQIRESNEADLKLFQALDEKLNFLNAAIASGDQLGLPNVDTGALHTFTEEEATQQGLSVPKADMGSDNKKLKPSDQFIAYHSSKQANKAVGIHLN